MRTIHKLIIGAILIMAANTAFTQQSFSLKDCISYSAANNSNIKIAGYNVEISGKRVSEQVGVYLPQINASGSLDDNLKLATQLLPAEMTGGPPGTFIPITFGNKYSVAGGIQLTQKLFDATSLSNIKASKIGEVASAEKQQKTTEETVYSISLSYYQTMVIKMSVDVLKTTLLSSDESLKSIELKYNNGMAKKIDVDKIRVSYNNTRSKLEQTELAYLQSLNILKFNMGMPVEQQIVLSDTTLEASQAIMMDAGTDNFRMENIIDYRLQETNLLQRQADRQTMRSAYLPILSFYGNYNYNAMRQEFNFFSSGEDWYPNSAIGFKLSVPIFSGLQRNSRVAQSDLNISIAKENLSFTEQSLRLDISNSQNKYNNALDNISREKENVALAKSVYESTQLEYQQGACSTLDLIQSQTSYLVSESNYYNRLLELYIARIQLEKAKGSLLEFINTIN